VKLKAKKQLLGVLGLVGLGVVVGLAGLLLAVAPQRTHAASLDKKIVAAQAQFASLHARSGRGPDLHAAQLFQLSRAMPDDADMPSIINDLSRAAARSSVSILAFTPSPTVVQTDGATAIPLQLTVTGNWHGVSSFLRALRTDVRVGKSSLEVSGRVFVVDSVTLSLAGSGAAPSTAGGAKVPSGELSAALTLDAFTYGVPAPPVSTDTTSTSTTTTPAPPGSAVASGSTGSAG
jgi:hypothetical protein